MFMDHKLCLSHYNGSNEMNLAGSFVNVSGQIVDLYSINSGQGEEVRIDFRITETITVSAGTIGILLLTSADPLFLVYDTLFTQFSITSGALTAGMTGRDLQFTAVPGNPFPEFVQDNFLRYLRLTIIPSGGTIGTGKIFSAVTVDRMVDDFNDLGV